MNQSATTTPTASGRKVGLEIIRGLAAIMIVLFHFTSAYNRHEGNDGIYATDWGWSVDFGFAAVTTFFMLSGYLTARLIYGKGRTPGRFFIGKLRRFYPAYWICMTLTAIVLALFYSEEGVTLLQWAANLTMVSRLFGVPFVDGAYWTMQCELQFAIIAALLIGVKSEKRITAVLAAWIALALIVGLVNVKALKVVRIVLMASSCQDFVAGMMVWRIASLPLSSAASRAAMWKPIAVLMLCTCNVIVWYGVFSPAMAFFSVTAVMLLLADRIERRIDRSNLAVRGICFIAAISYPLYLLHEMIGFTIIRHLQAAGITHPAAIAVPVVAVAALAWAVYRLEMKIRL